MCRAPATKSVLDEVVPFLDAPLLDPRPIGNVRAAAHLQRVRVALRALRSRHRARQPLRRPRASAHGFRRLERRHESSRPRRPRRERVARMVPRDGAERLRCRSAIVDSAAISLSAIATMRAWLTGILELAWDGGWYRRAYFDDGTPLGSAQNEECKIDSLTQSWAVLSDAAQPSRARQSMEAVRAHLLAARRPDCAAADAALRSHGARSGLHQRLSSGHPRERRPVHARGALGR